MSRLPACTGPWGGTSPNSLDGLAAGVLEMEASRQPFTAESEFDQRLSATT